MSVHKSMGGGWGGRGEGQYQSAVKTEAKTYLEVLGSFFIAGHK